MKNFSTVRVLVGCLAVCLSAITACGRSALDEPKGAGGTAGAGATTGVLPPTPGLFLCGTATCSTSSQQCCLGVDAMGGLGASCGRIGSTCAGAAFQCDEPADCRSSATGTMASSTVCCFGLDSPAASSGSASGLGLGSRCETAAACSGAGRFVLCSTDADCGPNGRLGVCCAAIGLPVCQPRCLPL